MITENKVIKSFCVINEFYKNFNAELGKSLVYVIDRDIVISDKV